MVCGKEAHLLIGVAVATEVMQQVPTRHVFHNETHGLGNGGATADHADDIRVTPDALHQFDLLHKVTSLRLIRMFCRWHSNDQLFNSMLADLFIPMPFQLLWEAFSQPLLREEYSFTYLALSILTSTAE